MNVRLERLRKRRAALTKANRDLLDKADGDGDRELTEEEEATFGVNQAELETLAGKVEREEQLAELEKTAAAAYIPENQPGDQLRIENKGPAWKTDPKCGFKTPREFMLCVMQASRDGRTEDERLLFLRADEGLKRLAAVGSDEAGTYSDPYGGFLVPGGFSPSLLQIRTEADPLGGRVTQIPMTAPSIKIPARVDKDHSSSVSGGFRVYRTSETQTVTASRAAFEMVTLDANPLMGISYATEQLLTDSPISFAALIEAGFRSEFASKLMDERINGTGVGQFTGLLNAGCKLEVSRQAGQAADTIVWENVRDMRARCWGYGSAVWLYCQDALPTLMSMYMQIGAAGVAMWQTSAREGEPDTILGRPAFATEYCKTVGDAGDLILTTPSEYLEGTYQQIEGAESVHVRFLYNERTFRFVMRNDGGPWWRTALTPKNGSTLSPIVTLEARA